MLQLILAGVGFSIWTLYIIMTYYSDSFSSITHKEATSAYSGYLVTLILIYASYKIYSIFFSGKRTIRYTFYHIFGFSLLQFFILCISYTSFAQAQVSNLFGGVSPSSMMLFSHGLSLLIYPIVLVIIVRSFGSTVLNKIIEGWETESLRLRFPVETTFGFFIFSSGLLFLGAFSWYTLNGLIALLGVMTVLSIPGLKETYRNITKSGADFENHKLTGGTLAALAPRLLSVELSFIIVSFLIGVSLISAIRPMPIGWDDLGVYMNFPKIMALSGENLKGAAMFAWQLITGTGYLFNYIAAQAFYINQLGGILAVITITAGLSLIFEIKNKKYLLSLPIIFATIFYAMPMNIFQQAKDMKLDPALLFISISGFLLLFSAWKEGNSRRKNYSLLGLAGVLVGFAFSVKYTTMMLILGGLGYMTYKKLSITGFFGFFFLFLATFTKLELWKIMNVWMPLDKPELMSNAIIIMTLIGISCLVVSYMRVKRENFIELVVGSLIFIAGITVGTSPWLVKNIIESKPWNVAATEKPNYLNAVLSGSGGTFIPDFSQIYSDEEYQKKQDASKDASITSDGKSQNEDFGRYFGYEKGLNNYLKLPANLTFQKNQPGEFTEITYIFLAFIPAILLFVRGRRGLYSGGIAFLLGLMFLYYFNKSTGLILTDFIGKYELPLGYLLILGFNVIFLLFNHFGIEKDEMNDRLKGIIMILGVYGFLFWISAFGIVWYGILVYFLFLALIGLAAMNFVTYDEKDEKDPDILGVKVTLTLIFVIFILTYFIRSALPHGWNNFKEASYNEFKYNVLNQEESIFAYRQDYIAPIAALNVKDPEALMKDIKSQATSKNLKNLFASDKLDGIGIRDFAFVLFSLSNTKDKEVAADAKKLGQTLYEAILYPKGPIQNDGKIYRIGTFMTYLIDKNRQRYLEDSLVFSFESFFYDKSPEATIDRMKKIGIKYLLVDLNAATIDKDPRHALTVRFEHLLHTMKARNLKLVETDNLCLKFAIDLYQEGGIQDDESFIDIAGTNYESYRTLSGTEVVIPRGQKSGKCYNQVLKSIFSEKGIENYPYLAPVKDAIDAEKAYGTDAESQRKLQRIFAQYFSQSWFALFEIYDAPKLAEPILPAVTNSGTVLTGTGEVPSSGTSALIP